MSELLKRTKELFLVPKCKCCGRVADSENLCDSCRTDMEKYRIPPSRFKTDKNFELVDKVYGAYYYKENAKKAVTRAKFKNPARFLNSLLADISIDIASILEENNIDMVMAVPYHKSKLYSQEYDLPEEMAKRIAAHFDIEYSACAKKIRKTAKQHDLSKEKRKINLAGAFRITGNVSGKNILIVDDVITTGVTISTFATELKLAGARKVYAWAYTYNT